MAIFFCFDFEFLAKKGYAQYKKWRYGANISDYLLNVEARDYFPFRLPIGTILIIAGIIVSLGAFNEYSSTSMYRSLSSSITESYDEFKLQKESKNPVRTDIRVDIHRVRLDAWNPPKHVYVDFFDLTTGKEYERVYVSKHCNKANELVRGDEYNIQVQVYTLSTRPGEEFREFKNLYGTFC